MSTKFDPQKQAQVDQAIAALASSIPPLLAELYKGFLANGFDEKQALQLCGDYLRAFIQKTS